MHGDYSEKRPVNAKDYLPEGGLSYRNLRNADALIHKMYCHEIKLWALDENVPLARRNITVAQCENCISNMCSDMSKEELLAFRRLIPAHLGPYY